MEKDKPRFAKYLFVCENEKAEGDCCGAAGSKIRELLKQAVKERGFAATVRVSRSGCQDVCGEGPNVLLMPDRVWFKRVEETDIPSILEASLKGVEK